ncbi:MAG TPA: nuclear transport factor 2 family protein [Candidatus Binatia bacterium]|jgi:ketosteroid isomerase-like protein
MKAIERWHEIVKARDVDGLDELLADDVVFHSPVVHTPQRGRTLTKLYLSAAVMVLGNDSFRYVREVVSGDSAVLEFVTRVGDTEINGVDLIRWNTDDRICDFKVMIRPLRAIQLIHQMMGAQLAPQAGS